MEVRLDSSSLCCGKDAHNDASHPGEQLRAPLGPGGEGLTPASMEILSLLQLPKFLKWMLSAITSLTSADRITAALLKLMHTKTIMEERANIVARDEYRRRWAERWREEGLDFVITVPMALPALQHGESLQTSLIGAGYTFLFSLVSRCAYLWSACSFDSSSSRYSCARALLFTHFFFLCHTSFLIFIFILFSTFH